MAATSFAGRLAGEGSSAVQRWLEALKLSGAMTLLKLPQFAAIGLILHATDRAVVAYVGSRVDEFEGAFAT